MVLVCNWFHSQLGIVLFCMRSHEWHWWWQMLLIQRVFYRHPVSRAWSWRLQRTKYLSKGTLFMESLHITQSIHRKINAWWCEDQGHQNNGAPNSLCWVSLNSISSIFLPFSHLMISSLFLSLFFQPCYFLFSSLSFSQSCIQLTWKFFAMNCVTIWFSNFHHFTCTNGQEGKDIFFHFLKIHTSNKCNDEWRDTKMNERKG